MEPGLSKFVPVLRQIAIPGIHDALLSLVGIRNNLQRTRRSSGLYLYMLLLENLCRKNPKNVPMTP
jgi:hypothetical protein